MESEIKQQEVKSVTPNQEALYAKLLQSSCILKRERDKITLLIKSRHMTTKDASVLIDYLILKLRFIRHFNLETNHSVAECIYCGEKTGLKRFVSSKTSQRVWFCNLHGIVADVSEWAEVPLKTKDEN